MRIPGHYIAPAEKPAAITKQPAAAQIAHTASKPAGAAVSRSLRSTGLVTALGLPAGRLSTAVVAAARFFSLPLEPGLLAKIRRQALQPGQLPQPGLATQGGPAAAAGGVNETTGASFENRDAPVLAAAAAADKGVELTPAGLADYTAAIDPEAGRNAGGHGGQNGKKQDNNRKNTEKKAEEDHFLRSEAIDPLYLREKIIEFAEQSPLLGLMNRLPGKNGRQWIVLPFSFSENGARYHLSLKIMLNDAALGSQNGHMAGHMAGQMALEIVKSGADGGKRTDDAEQRWLFVLDSGRRPQDSQLTLRLWPPRPQRALQSLAGRLSQALNIAPERVFVENYTKLSFFSPENRQEVLLSVNEQV
jgi:hypothetical protein